jgi:hypothetical protein
MWIERRREKSKEGKKRKRKIGQNKWEKRKSYNIYYLVVLYGSIFVGLEGSCILGLCRHDDSFQMLVESRTTSGLQEIHISRSQWAGGAKVHLEEVFD